ncbi:MAG: AAA family ATPase [Pseudomonadota bacterium]
MSAVTDQLRPIDRALARVNSVILGKDQQVKLCITCILAEGHLLIEDVPGVGKTTLAHALAKSLGLNYQRIQFTSDLLPADIIGVSIYRREEDAFRFHKGPIFAQLVLADEVNRATPKTQSALLEAMEEGQVTAEGETYGLPQPFFVVATQNPAFQIGTFPLPESQLDRFLMRVQLGFPAEHAERALLRDGDQRATLRELEAVLQGNELLILQRAVDEVHVSEALLDYVQAIVRFTRESDVFDAGLSPRGALALLKAARAWTLLDARSAVLPEDVQAVLGSVVGHRLKARDHAGPTAVSEVAKVLLESVPVP